MMQAYRTENSYRSAARLSPAELRAAMASGEILQATALAFDTRRQLRFELGGVKAVMPFAQCADGAETGTVRDIAVLTRVGRPTCFVIEGLDTDEDGTPCYRLSRAEAQRLCKAEYLDTLSPGDILPCTVTHIEPFGAFCDVGCGISALLPIDCMSVSRISSPADRVSVGQQILCQQIVPDALRLAQGNGAAKLCMVHRLHEQPCRAADFKGTMRRQRLVFFISNACCGQQLLELFHRVRLLFYRENQSILSSSPSRISSSLAAL